MTYTCPKCGKKMDLSTEVLISSEYKVICPQCLSELQIVGDYAYIPHDSLQLNTSAQPSSVISCPSCGHEASTSAHFCPNCGAGFDALATPPAVPAVDDVTDVTQLPPPIPASGDDPLLQAALQFLSQCTSITPMMLRDRFNISIERARQLLGELEAAGAVGPYNNGGPRQILIPHRGLYDRAPMQEMAGSTPRPQPQQRSGGIGCWGWLMIFFLFSFLIRACSG